MTLSNEWKEEQRQATLKSTTAIRAIRQFCILCVGTMPEVKKCSEEGMCPLWKFRLGKNPNMKTRVMSEEERKKLAERMRSFKNAKAVAQGIAL